MRDLPEDIQWLIWKRYFSDNVLLYVTGRDYEWLCWFNKECDLFKKFSGSSIQN